MRRVYFRLQPSIPRTWTDRAGTYDRYRYDISSPLPGPTSYFYLPRTSATARDNENIFTASTNTTTTSTTQHVPSRLPSSALLRRARGRRGGAQNGTHTRATGKGSICRKSVRREECRSTAWANGQEHVRGLPTTLPETTTAVQPTTGLVHSTRQHLSGFREDIVTSGKNRCWWRIS